jgi:protein-S-isoprenylcysteine O-methyltransferase Ste14
MNEKGIGPGLVVVSLSYFFVALILYSSYPSIFLLPQAFSVIYVLIGIILTIFGFIMYVLGASVVKKAFREGRLITDGAYGIVRNPMYLGLTIFVST